MPRTKRYSLVTFLLTLLFLTVVAGISNLAINSIEKETKQQIHTSLQTVLQTTVTAYQIWIQYRKRDATELAGTFQVVGNTRTLLSATSAANKHLALIRLRDYLQPKLKRENDLGFMIISPLRLNIASAQDSNLNKPNLIHMQRPDYLNRAFAGETLFVPTLFSEFTPDAPNHDTNDRALSVFVISPITANDEVIAVMALQINLNSLFTHVSTLARPGDTGETYAFDKQAMLITESRFDQQLRNTRMISPDSKSILNIRITDPGGNIQQGYKPRLPPEQRPLTLMAASAVRGESGFNLEGYRDYRGVPVFGTWLWDHDLGFGITTEMDVEEAMSSFYKTRQTIIGVLLLILLMSLALLAYVIRTQQLRKLDLQRSRDTLEHLVTQRTAELNATRQQLETANHELEVLATTDSLTSLSNRRCFDSHLEKEWLHCCRENKTLAILLIDIDYFKQYNDFYGHLRGDECLQHVAGALKAASVIRRPGDLIARYGGEEFAVILSDPSPEYVRQTAERLRTDVYNLNIEHSGVQQTRQILTISVGYAMSASLAQTSPEALIDQADQALYKAKSLGRNQSYGQATAVTLADTLQSQG